MRAQIVLATVILIGCAKPERGATDSSAAAVQAGVDSMAAHAEQATHDSTATPGLKPTPPIFERNQRDSTGRPLPRTPAQSPPTRLPTKQDSVIPPGPPQLRVDTLVRKPPR